MEAVDGQRRGLAGHHEGKVVNIGRGPPLALGVHGHYRQIAGLAALSSQTSVQVMNSLFAGLLGMVARSHQLNDGIGQDPFHQIFP